VEFTDEDVRTDLGGGHYVQEGNRRRYLPGVYAPGVPCRVSAEIMHAVYADVMTTGVIDAHPVSITTGYGSFTTGHLDDSDYIISLSVIYADKPGRAYETVYGIRGGKPELWIN